MSLSASIVEIVQEFMDNMTGTLNEQGIVAITFTDNLYDLIYTNLRSLNRIPESTEVLTVLSAGGEVPIKRQNPYPKLQIEESVIDVDARST